MVAAQDVPRAWSHRDSARYGIIRTPWLSAPHSGKSARTPRSLSASSLVKEQLLEDMIVRAPALLSEEWMLIGRQEDTGFGGRIDLLAIVPDASLVLVELKRDRTPREVVAQAIDYAGWVEGLKSEDVRGIYERFAHGRTLADDFRARFGVSLDEGTLNQNHQIVIVAESLDDSTERIINYLNARGISINVLCFQVFAHEGGQLLGRTWLIDPVQSQINAAQLDRAREPWNGEFYCSFGHDKERNWEDARELGFISGGGGSWYSKTLHLLGPGDRVWVKVPGQGFVGVGRVSGRARPMRSSPLVAGLSGRWPSAAGFMSDSTTIWSAASTSCPSSGSRPWPLSRPCRRSACLVTKTPYVSRRRPSGDQRWSA